MSASALRAGQAASLVRDWIAPGNAIAQWTHFVTSTCNARCRHCFYPINQRQNELTLEEIERFLSSVPPIRLLLFSGGEPFLRKDLPEIVKAYHDRCGFYTASIPTNGYSAARIRPMIERICDIAPALHLGVAVSLDGMSEFHDRVRRVPRLWDHAIETLRMVIDLSQRYPNLTAGVITVFMRENQAELEPLCDFVYGLRPTFHTLNFIRGKPVDGTLAQDLDVDRYVALSKWLSDRYSSDAKWSTGSRGIRARARNEINRQRYEYIARQARGGEFEGFCLAGEREYVMSETGDIMGCELIGDKLGNIRDAGYEFSKIRDGDAARAFVDAKRSRHCKCTHECNTRTMLLFDRRKALPLIAAALGLRQT